MVGDFLCHKVNRKYFCSTATNKHTHIHTQTCPVCHTRQISGRQCRCIACGGIHFSSSVQRSRSKNVGKGNVLSSWAGRPILSAPRDSATFHLPTCLKWTHLNSFSTLSELSIYAFVLEMITSNLKSEM